MNKIANEKLNKGNLFDFKLLDNVYKTYNVFAFYMKGIVFSAYIL